MRSKIGRIVALVALATVTTLVPVRALAGSHPLVDNAGAAQCWGAFMTGGAHFVGVYRPIVYAYNQHPNKVDWQTIKFRALLYRWNGSSWQPVVQTRWFADDVYDRQADSIQLPGYTTRLDDFNIHRQGYYMVLFDIRWVPSGTVTINDSTSLWAHHINETGGHWVGPTAYCDYVAREISFPIDYR
jgi:hypothetical protein